MNIKDITVGDRVLVQSGTETREVATIKGINYEDGMAIVKLSDGNITEMDPYFIIKTFGML